MSVTELKRVRKRINDIKRKAPGNNHEEGEDVPRGIPPFFRWTRYIAIRPITIEVVKTDPGTVVLNSVVDTPLTKTTLPRTTMKTLPNEARASERKLKQAKQSTTITASRPVASISLEITKPTRVVRIDCARTFLLSIRETGIH
jgi:hypothetical protein